MFHHRPKMEGRRRVELLKQGFTNPSRAVWLPTQKWSRMSGSNRLESALQVRHSYLQRISGLIELKTVYHTNLSLSTFISEKLWRWLGDFNSIIRPYRGRSSAAMINHLVPNGPRLEQSRSWSSLLSPGIKRTEPWSTRQESNLRNTTLRRSRCTY